MKRFLMLAAVVGGLTLCGFSSTANAGYGHGGSGHGGGGYGHGGWGHGFGGYGYRGGYGPRYGYRGFGYGYNPYVVPGIYAAGPGFGIGVNTGIGYGNPYNSCGSSAYPSANYGW